MSTKGAKVAFSEEEKLTFTPIFVNYLNKKYGSAEILAALGGDESKFARFITFSDSLKSLIHQRQQKSKIEKLENSKVLLVKSIQNRESAIKQSREKATEEVIRLKEPLRI